MRGTIETIVFDKGFGFIRRPGAADLFFHCSALDPKLEFSDRLIERVVEYDVRTEGGRARAINVRGAS